jgi:hypothetical protein
MVCILHRDWTCVASASGDCRSRQQACKKYYVRPNNDMVAPRSKADVVGNLVDHMILMT